jgi:hypothetical protein
MRRVRALLEVHDEPYDVLSRRTTEGGFGDPRVRHYDCGACGGGGCPRCVNGKVEVEERDAYDTGFTGAGMVQPVDEKHLRDNLLRRLREDELKRAGVIEDFPFQQAFRLAEERDSHGSFKTLRACVDNMPRMLRGEKAIAWLALVMPKTIRVPHHVHRAELEDPELHAEIRALKSDGLRPGEIAKELGIGKKDVRDILRRKP